jgi:sugar lactone lactonase YvrE
VVGRITTVAGTESIGLSGDGGQATSSQIYDPNGVAIDASGNIYFTEPYYGQIRKVTVSTGVLSTVAGTGTGGYSGDGGQATSAMLQYPQGIALDTSGNIYIVDSDNHRIRKVTVSTGNINTMAGDGNGGYSGDGGQATSAMMYNPKGVALDTSGNIYIADYSNERIRKVTVSTGVITTVAGNGFQGYSGDGGQATSATINTVSGVALDTSGNIYIADYHNSRIRKVTISSGNITTVAGTGTGGYSGDGGQATSAKMFSPIAVALDTSGNIYISDSDDHRIRKVTVSTGNINTVAGNGTGGYSGDGGQATSAMISNPKGIAVDSSENVYFSSTSFFDSYSFANNDVSNIRVVAQQSRKFLL